MKNLREANVSLRFFYFKELRTFDNLPYDSVKCSQNRKGGIFMEKVIRFNRDEQRTIVRGLYDMCNAMADGDPQKRELELLILRAIDAPEFIPWWRRIFK